MKIVVAGPPHSGKSVFLQGLVQNLPRKDRYLFRACPDGEGTWTYKSAEAGRFRRKGRFTGDLVGWYARALADNNMAPIVLVDIGGRPSEENRRILTEGKVEAAVILSGNPAAIGEWKAFVEGCGCRVIATIHSDYEASVDNVLSDPMVVHHLERGEDVSGRPVVQKVAQTILELAQVGRKEEELKMMNGNVISIPGLAAALGKAPVQRTLPNGRVVEQIVWEGRDLVAISRLFHNRSAEMPEVVDIDGAAPAWLVAALVHELHPRSVRVNSPDGYVPVECRRPTEEGMGENLSFSVEEKADGWTWITCQQVEPSVPLRPEALSHVAPPALPMGAKVVLSGRIPNWLAASLAMAYHGTAKAVALFQPGTGATVAWTHAVEVGLGSIISD